MNPALHWIQRVAVDDQCRMMRRCRRYRVPIQSVHLVDSYIVIIRMFQKGIRGDLYHGVSDMVLDGDLECDRMPPAENSQTFDDAHGVGFVLV